MKIKYPVSQSGATLIVVLFILLLMTIIGTIAVKVATTSLKISTNSQISQLLRQAADTPFQVIRNLPANKLRAADNAIGSLIVGNDINSEYLFCYSPTVDKDFARSTKTTIISPLSTTNEVLSGDAVRSISGGVTGLCRLNTDFGSKRDATVTQVAVSLANDVNPDRDRFLYYAEGTDITGGAAIANVVSQPTRLRVTTIAMLPNYSSTSISDIQTACFTTANLRLVSNIDYPTKKTIADCIQSYGVPVEVQTQEFVLKTTLTEISKPN